MEGEARRIQVSAGNAGAYSLLFAFRRFRIEPLHGPVVVLHHPGDLVFPFSSELSGISG
jgi:hypothetical protein